MEACVMQELHTHMHMRPSYEHLGCLPSRMLKIGRHHVCECLQEGEGEFMLAFPNSVRAATFCLKV